LARLATLAAELGAASGREPVTSRLAEVASLLRTVPAREGAQAVRQFLDARTDVQLPTGFQIAADGFLTEAPALRVWLLDQLERLDPKMAADYAVRILDTYDSPDEWAVALRSLGRGNPSPQGRELLRQKARELALHELWRQAPTTGFLEAFDTFVFLRDTEFTPALAGMLAPSDNPGLAHAAYLALDRLVLQEPAEVLERLRTQPELMKGREATRANYFARADLSDPRQRTIVEQYLLAGQLAGEELTTFAGLFPSGNYLISHNLLSTNPTPDHATLVRRDREALRVVQEWLADARFERLRPELQSLHNRLQTFVRQAEGRE
jgi:hypothetical protein